MNPDIITIEPEVLPDTRPAEPAIQPSTEPSPWKFPAPAVDPTIKGLIFF